MAKYTDRLEKWYDHRSTSEKYSDRVAAKIVITSLSVFMFLAIVAAGVTIGIGSVIMFIMAEEHVGLPITVLTLVVGGIIISSLISARK